MDHSESGGVYAAEKIIRKRYKKVNLKTINKISIHEISLSAIES